MSANWPMVKLREVLTRSEETIALRADVEYRELTVRLWGKGIVLRGIVMGAEVAASRRFIVKAGQFVLSRIDARNGALGLVPDELDGAIVTNDFPVFMLDETKLVPAFLGWMSRTADFVEMCRRASEGTTNRVRLQEDRFLALEIPLPPFSEQRRIVVRIEELCAQVDEARRLRQQTTEETEVLVGARATEMFETIGNCLPIEDVANVRGGIQKSPHRAPGANPVRYLTVAHVQRNRVLTGDPRYFEVTPEELERWRLLAGDVLIIEGNGSAEQIGRTALFRGEIADCVH